MTICLLGGPRDAAARLGAKWLPYDAPLYSAREQLLGGRAMHRAGADVYHFPHYAVPRWPPRPYIVTVHDLIHFRYPDHFGRARIAMARRVLLRAVAGAAAVGCVSESTRRDLEAMAPDAIAKLRVTRDGVSDRFAPAGTASIEALRTRYGLGPYVLSMGDRAPHKRFDLVAASFQYLRGRDPALRLAVVGERGPSGVTDPPGTLRLDYVSDEDLRTLYSGAACLLFPSEYRGVRPPAARGHGVRMPSGVRARLVARRGLRWSGNPGGPRRPGNRRRRLAAADHPEARARIAETGLAHARAFSWLNTARRTLDIFASVASDARQPASPGRKGQKGV